jgi:hypothetical protein
MRYVFLARIITPKSALKCGLLIILALSTIIYLPTPADAGGMGRFLGSLVARGAVRGAIIAGRSSSDTAAPKVYSSDVLTVEQLAQCIKQATKLDGDNDHLEIDRSTLKALVLKVDVSQSFLEMQRANLDRSSQKSVNAFNALIDQHNGLVNNAKAKQADFNALIDAHNLEANAYNTTCTKKYYSEDLPEAQKLATRP